MTFSLSVESALLTSLYCVINFLSSTNLHLGKNAIFIVWQKPRYLVETSLSTNSASTICV